MTPEYKEAKYLKIFKIKNNLKDDRGEFTDNYSLLYLSVIKFL